jgi:hypothetical protein
MKLLCPYCRKEVRRVPESKQFIHANEKDYFACLKLPTYCIGKSEAPNETTNR